jgi:predicted  nucleic acid-binding Zn-ribbon protein
MMNGLDNEQRAQWAQRIQDMDRDRERMNTRLQQMDQQMAKSDPDRTRIQEQARDMEQAMSQWRKQYKAMQSDATNP